jgi:AcrR family transcriptional regulator
VRETTTNGEGSSVGDRLLNAAEQVVARDGVANLTLEAVAKQAGVSKGGLLYHFPSKSALVTAIVDRLACRCEADQTEALQHDPTSPGAFTRAYMAARTQRPDPQEQPVHTAILAAAGTNPQYLAPFHQRAAEWQKRMENDGIDIATAWIVRLAIDGLCLVRLLGGKVPEGLLLEEVIARLTSMTRMAAQTPPDEAGKIPAPQDGAKEMHT